MRIAVLGAGSIGCACTVELCRGNHEVRLWGRSEATIAPLRDSGAVAYDGILGVGTVSPAVMTTDLQAVLEGSDAVLVCLPASAHRGVAERLADADVRLPILLNPGGVGGALRYAQVLRSGDRPGPDLTEFSTATHVARRSGSGVSITGSAARLLTASLPNSLASTALASSLFPQTVPAPDVLATSLSNVNVVLHPPGAILGAAWVEASAGGFRFYAEGTTAGVAAAIRRLDDERLAVAGAFDHRLPTLLDEMAAIGTVEPAAAEEGDWQSAIAGGVANRDIRAPDSLEHRYYREDLAYGLAPMTVLADIADVKVPLSRALLEIGRTICAFDPTADGVTAEDMGIAGFDRKRLLILVRGTSEPSTERDG